MLIFNNFIWSLPATHWGGRAMGLGAGLLVALLSTGTAAQQDTPQQRKQDLRSTVRQLGVGQTTGQSAVAPSAADDGLRHLNAQERGELRRQLTRELRAQRPSTEPLRR